MEDKNLLRRALEDYFGSDRRRIEHACQVASFARELLELEGGEPEVVLAAAYLHDVGIREAERKYGSSAGWLQEREGPPIAREILENLGYPEPVIEEVCTIIAHHHSPGKVDTTNFRILYDADWLVNFPEYYGERPRQEKARFIERIFLTQAGRARAQELFLP
jgi:HD superfamily phosphodiesterase